MLKDVVFTYLEGLAPIPPLLVLFFQYRRIELTGKVWVLVFFLFCFAAFIWADHIGYKGDNNLLIYNLVPLCWVLFLFFFFRKVLQVNRYKNISAVSVCVFAILYLSTPEYLSLHRSFASVYYISFSIFILLNAALYYFQEFNSISGISIWAKKEFWFISILLFYASISSVIWFSFKLLVDKAENLKASKTEMHFIGDLWKLGNIVFALSCLFFSIILYVRSPRRIQG